MNFPRWSELAPGKKRLVMVVLALTAIIALVSIFSKEPEDKPKRGAKDTIRHVLTNKNTRDIGIDALVGNVKTTKADQNKLVRKLEKLEKELADVKSKAGASENIGGQMSQLKKELLEVKQRNKMLNREFQKLKRDSAKKIEQAMQHSAKQKPSPSNVNAAPEKGETTQQTSDVTLDPNDPSSFFQKAPLPEPSTSRSRRKGRYKGDDESAESSVAPIKIVSVTESVEEESEAENDKDEERDGIYMPLGSILTGVTITGMDAPTSKGARKDPFPSLIRIQKEAILPNRFREDVRECFMILSGYGDMSSERAYLRSEAISCIRDDGAVIESSIKGYAVGEDGKAGIRGRLVSKQTAMIKQSLKAGFAKGFADALDTNPVPVVNTNPSDSAIYQEVFNKNAVRSGFSSGASTAMEKVAQFYLDLAEGMFPVIEIDAGRQIEIVITKGQKLKLKSEGSIKNG